MAAKLQAQSWHVDQARQVLMSTAEYTSVRSWRVWLSETKNSGLNTNMEMAVEYGVRCLASSVDQVR